MNLPWLNFYAHLARAGFSPKVIYDIGASIGNWSLHVSKVFPDAIYHLFEPLGHEVERYREELQMIRSCHPRYHVHTIVLGKSFGHATLSVSPDPTGSTSLNIGRGLSEFFPRAIDQPQHSLDELLSAKIIAPAQLIKLDVQGSEASILRGASQALSSVQVLQVECWLYPCYGPQTPLLGEIVSMLGERGFIAVDSSDPYYDSKSHQFCALDLYFVQEALAKDLTRSSPTSNSWITNIF